MAVIIDGQTASFNKAMAQSQGQLASFTGGIKQVGVSLGVAFGASAIFDGLKAGIAIMAEFEATMSEVKAITGATGKEFEALEADAKRLGAATKFTSTQVGQLQIAYGRLGFNTKEILDATEATLALAAATGEDLAKSADVAGSTVRGFGLEARETQRVVDVMAKSFNTTALGLENFTESMKYVAPVAAAANLSLEDTTALLGTLADAGIRGSMAGTALRKILTDLPKDGRPFQERLDELSKKGISVADSMDEVGRTAQTALLILTKNNDKTKELAASFQNVAGEAAKMARIMADNLAGDVEKLSSAWEGLILKVGNTDFLRRATQSLTTFLGALSGTPDFEFELNKLAEAIKAETVQATVDEFIERLQKLRKEAGKPIDTNIAFDLAEKFKLSDEQANELYSSLLKVNEALSFQEKTIKNFDESALVARYGKTTEALDKYKQGIYENILAQQIYKSQLEKVNFDGAFNDGIKSADSQIANYRRVIEILNVYGETFVKTEAKVQAATVATVKNLKYYQEALKKVNDTFEEAELRTDLEIDIKIGDKVYKEFDRFTESTISNLRILAAEGAGLEDFIKRVNRLKESFKDIDTFIKPPDISGLLDPIKEIEVAVGGIKFDTLTTSSEEVFARFEARIAKTAEVVKQSTAQISKSIEVDMAPLISTAIVGIADAIGQAAAGVGSFGDNIIKVVAGFARQLGEILIATATAIIVTKKLMITNPYAALAAGILLVALSSAAGSAISKSHGSSFGGGGSGSSGGISRTSTESARSATEAQNLNVTGQIVARGQDLWVIFNNYENSNKFLKANG